MVPELIVSGVIPLTIVSDVDRSARSENGVSVGILMTGGVRGAVLDLGAETRSISAQVCETTRRVVHLFTNE